jgi:glycosyltransferase involved in cell wall biosynthesis
MRLGFGVTVLARCLQSGGVDGIGSYTRELLKRLLQADGMTVVPVSFGVPVPSTSFFPGNVEQFGKYSLSAALSAAAGFPFPGTARLSAEIDLMHATDHMIPKLGKVPVVATLMDAIPLSHPEWVTLRFRTAKNALWKKASHWATQIITISEYSKCQIAEHFGLPPERISVTPLGVDERWFRPVAGGKWEDVSSRLGLPEHFFLFVGTLQPRKNVGRVIDAYRALPRAVRDEVPLLIAGRAGWQCDDVVSALTSQAYGSSVRWLRHLPDDDLLAVMKNATALVQPSLYEGFGLPVLEAFAAGAPVITSNTTALPEVAGDAAILVDPLDTGAISEAMTKLLENGELAGSLRSRGRLRAKAFSWDRTAAMTLDVYRRTLEG